MKLMMIPFCFCVMLNHDRSYIYKCIVLQNESHLTEVQSLNHNGHHGQGSKFHSFDRLRWVKMTVGQVEYLHDLSDGRLRISDFHISCIGFIYFRQVNGTFGQVIFTIHLPNGQVHSIWNFEAWWWDITSGCDKLSRQQPRWYFWQQRCWQQRCHQDNLQVSVKQLVASTSQSLINIQRVSR